MYINVSMENNYFYDLPKDLQDRIYYINAKNCKSIVNKQLHTIYNSVKCINKAVNELERDLYAFAYYNNINNESVIQNNIPLIKAEIIEELHLKKIINIMISIFYLEIFEYISDNEFSEKLIDNDIINSIETIIESWYIDMEEILFENH